MKRMRNLHKETMVVVMGIILAAVLTGCASEELCLYPGCDNERIRDGACYEHLSSARSSSYSSDYNSSYSSSTYEDETEEETSSYNNQSTVNNSGTKKYDTLDVTDYDDPDEYASDFAEDFAYDEFEEDSWEAYEYGYEEAYDYWMDEMGE